MKKFEMVLKDDKGTKLFIDPKLDELMYPLTREEDESLDQSFQDNGFLSSYPLLVSKRGAVVDGMNRFKKCIKYKIVPEYVVKDFETFEEEKIFVLENVLARRHLNNFQRSEIGMRIFEVESELAKQRQQVKDLGPNGHKGKARDFTAKKIGVSPRTFERAKFVIQNATEEVKKKARTGSLSINSAYNLTIAKDRTNETPDLPTEIHNLLYWDPPWEFDNATIRGSAQNHYGTIPLAELKEFELPLDKKAVMLMWVPNSLIPEALELLEAHNFKYKTNLAWKKPNISNGSWIRNQHELLFLAIRGDIKTPAPDKKPNSVIESDKEDHSKKPDIYEMIETMFPKMKYLEMFARGKKKRDGWTFWGDEFEN